MNSFHPIQGGGAKTPALHRCKQSLFLVSTWFCQTPVLGLGLGVDFIFANINKRNNNKKNNKKNPHLNFSRRNGTMGMTFGAQT